MMARLEAWNSWNYGRKKFTGIAGGWLFFTAFFLNPINAMKKRMMILLASCLTILFAGCKEHCEKGFELADLLFDERALELVTGDTTGDLYSILNVCLNSAEDILCNKEKKECDAVSIAGENTFALEIYYDSAGIPPTDAAHLDTTFSASVEQLRGCEGKSMTDYLEFIQDGYYLIVSLIDYFEEVPERDESNNQADGDVGKMAFQQPLRVVVDRGLRSCEYSGTKPVRVKHLGRTVESINQ
jgi:hypothetical protein